MPVSAKCGKCRAFTDNSLFSTAIPVEGDFTQKEEFLAWSGRIVGGSAVAITAFNWQASLRTAAGGHFCGGTIIHNRWILSAAHCTIGRTTANTRVVVGTASRTAGTLLTTSAVVNHAGYNANTLANDISLVQTAPTMTMSASVGVATVPSAFFGSGAAVVSGWGQTSHPGSAAANLMAINTNVITLADCRARHTVGNRASVFDNTICTFTGAGQGTCMGDSGGPLMQSGTRNVIGAVSWGIACAQGVPDVYARVSSHRAWIVQNTPLS